MSILRSVLGADGGSVTEVVKTGIEQVGETKRNTTTQTNQTRRTELDVTKSFNAGSAFWRPFWMFALITATVLYILASIYFFKQWMDGMKLGSVWTVSSGMEHWRAGWSALGASLFSLAMASFLGYSPFRSMEKGAHTLTGTTMGTRIREKFNRQVPEPIEPEIVYVPAPDNTQTIKPYPGIRRPSGKPMPVPFINKPKYKNLGFKFGTTSTRRLARAHEDQQSLFNWLIKRTPYDFAIFETTRSIEKQAENVRNKVSWSMDSAHLRSPSYAVDFVIINPITGKMEWDDISYYNEVLAILKEGSIELGIPITSGGLDWGKDYFHVELNRAYYDYPPVTQKLKQTAELS